MPQSHVLAPSPPVPPVESDAGPTRACLLLHGFGGTPFEVEPLAAPLEAEGFHVRAPLLPGHGTSIADFRTTFFDQWLDAAEADFLCLRGRYDRVVLAGFSMGGALALLLAARHGCAGLACISTPLYVYRLCPFQLRDWRLPLVPVLKHLMPEVRMGMGSKASREVAPYRGYEGVMCLPQLHSMMQGLRRARTSLQRVRAPLLVLHDMGDRVAWPESALMLCREAASDDVTLCYTRIRETVSSRHMLTTHQETHDYAAAQVTAFARRVTD